MVGNTVISDEEKFSKWMIEKVKSIHYANNGQMANAYNRVTDNNNRLIIAYGTL
jgi:hypothetical protein